MTELVVATIHLENKEQAPSQQSKPNEALLKTHGELLMAALHGKSSRIEDILQRGEQDVVIDIENPSAVASSQALTVAGDSILHVVASILDTDDFLECATVIVRKANQLLGARNRKGDTPLHRAARLGNTRMVSHLVDLAKVENGDSAGGEKVKAVLRIQNEKGETVLHEAVRLGDKDMVGMLLSADSHLARVPLADGASPLYLAFLLGHSEIAQQLLEKDEEPSYSGPDGQNALHAAVLMTHGNDATQLLLERNKDLVKQADRSTGSTPLHLAVLWNTAYELLLEADPTAAYLPDSNGSFPIHVAVSFRNHLVVKKLLKKCGLYCAELRNGMGRTFLHVAVQEENICVVSYVCKQVHRDKFASSVMNMQDDDGNTALHLAVQVGNMCIFSDLLSKPEVKLNLSNNKGYTPLEFVITTPKKGWFLNNSNPRHRMHSLLLKADFGYGGLRRNNITTRQSMSSYDENGISQSMIGPTQTIALGSVLITTVTFAAAFALPGGYRADDHENGGTPTLEGRYAFDAFVIANTLAFICSGLSIIFLMYAGVGEDLETRLVSSWRSINFLASSARSLGAAFAFGMYAVLAPVVRSKAIAYSTITVVALGLVDVVWSLMVVDMAYSDELVLVNRFGSRTTVWKMPLVVLTALIWQFWPYIVIAVAAR